jgi:hypothetical protein
MAILISSIEGFLPAVQFESTLRQSDQVAIEEDNDAEGVEVEREELELTLLGLL